MMFIASRFAEWLRAVGRVLAVPLRALQPLFKALADSGLLKYWPHVGYTVSACAVLVTDILWLRTLMILANCCGIITNLVVLKVYTACMSYVSMLQIK
jgi:hypothetical protein